MGRFVKKLIGFLVFVIMFYGAALFFWIDAVPTKFKKNINYRLGSYGNMFTRVREIPKYSNVDILFLGSSHAYRGFDVRVFNNYGFKSFNLGSSSQTPIQTKLLLDRYVTTLNPKVVIYEVYPGTFCADGVESAVDIIANDTNDWESFKMMFNSRNAKVFNTFLYAITRDVLDLNKNYTERLIRAEDHDTYITGGYVEKEVFHYKTKPLEPRHWSFDPVQFAYFEEVIEKLKSKNMEVYLVYAPTTQGWYNAHDNNDYFDSVMASYGAYYNFNEILSLNDSVYFYDEHHLNQDGVELFNQNVVEVLNLN